jgi:hypothetical protein
MILTENSFFYQRRLVLNSSANAEKEILVLDSTVIQSSLPNLLTEILVTIYLKNQDALLLLQLGRGCI